GAGPIGQRLEYIMVILQSQADLLEMVAALHAAGCFAGSLHCRQQQGDEHADDGDHHQQLHQGKSTPSHDFPPAMNEKMSQTIWSNSVRSQTQNASAYFEEGQNKLRYAAKPRKPSR